MRRFHSLVGLRSLIEDHFSGCGPIESLSVSRGPLMFALIEFYNDGSYRKALQLNGTLFDGFPVVVEPATFVHSDSSDISGSSSDSSSGSGGDLGPGVDSQWCWLLLLFLDTTFA